MYVGYVIFLFDEICPNKIRVSDDKCELQRVFTSEPSKKKIRKYEESCMTEWKQSKCSAKIQIDFGDWLPGQFRNFFFSSTFHFVLDWFTYIASCCNHPHSNPCRTTRSVIITIATQNKIRYGFCLFWYCQDVWKLAPFSNFTIGH